MTQAQKMNAALEREVIAKLKADGFEGKFPHYRRVFPDRIELISFPKDKYGMHRPCAAGYTAAVDGHVSVAFADRYERHSGIPHHGTSLRSVGIKDIVIGICF